MGLRDGDVIFLHVISEAQICITQHVNTGDYYNTGPGVLLRFRRLQATSQLQQATRDKGEGSLRNVFVQNHVQQQGSEM
ncbi:hypothetical protein INR49_016492 [Caranx melampygus]|nr:hypothetical protein INR49_016492 [Caranx melampygus]